MLSAERKMRNQYRIMLRNKTGQVQKVTPDSLHYTIMAAVEEQPIIHSIGVGLENNSVRPYFAKGNGLPQKKMQKFSALRYAGWVKADGIWRSRRPAIQ
jgi:hypothetical protein